MSKKEKTNLSRQDKIRLAKETRDPKLLAELAEDEDYYIRLLVAANQFTSGQTLKKLHDDTIISISMEAKRNIEARFISTLYQYKEAETKIFQALQENDDLLHRISDETLKLLYERKYIDSKEWGKIQPILTSDTNLNTTLSDEIKCLEEGILLGSMLSGAWEHNVDLMVAQLTGKQVDEAKIGTLKERKSHIENIEIE